MRAVFYGLFLAISSRFFAGLYFYLAARNTAPLLKLRRMFAAVSLDGLLLAVAVMWRMSGPKSRTAGAAFFLCWMFSQIAVTLTEWSFVFDTFDVTWRGIIARVKGVAGEATVSTWQMVLAITVVWLVLYFLGRRR